MKRYSFILVFCALPLILAGCAGSASAGKERSSDYRTNLGSVPHADVVRIVDEALLSRYGYTLVRRVNTAEDVYYETEWRETAGLEDELSSGHAFNRVRIIVTARPRNRSGGIMGSFSATFRAESEVRRLGSNVWEEAPMSEERYDYIKEIADFIKQEFRTTFRNG